MEEKQILCRIEEITSSAIAFWEPARVLYNLILLLGILLECGFTPEPLLHALPELFLMLMIANIAYCIGYIPDLFVQLSTYRNRILPIRWLCWLTLTWTAHLSVHFPY